MSNEPNPPVIHAYGPARGHDDLMIVANREGLQVLRDTIDRALAAPLDCDNKVIVKQPGHVPMTRDGEGFDLIVWVDDSHWQGESWQERPFPYTDDSCTEYIKPCTKCYPIY